MTAQIGCAEAVRRLWDFLDGGLGDTDREAVEEHLAFCLRCCGELAFSQELQRLLRTKTGSELPPDAKDRLERFIDDLDDVTDEDQGVAR